MATFSVNGPFKVSVTDRRNGRIITKEDIRDFWMHNESFAAGVGCYVFAFRAARGYKPIYIGKTRRTFQQEVFTDHKVRKYNAALADQIRGTGVLFFVTLDKTKGPVNKRAIDEAESYLIQSGLVANSDLANDQKVKTPSWNIKGVIRGGRGAIPKPAKELRRCLNLA